MILNGVFTKDDLYKANDREIERLIERFSSDDFKNGIDNFFKRKIFKNKL